MLQKSPEQRPPGMAAVRAALEEILRDNAPAGAGPRSEMISPIERSRRPAAAATEGARAASGRERTGLSAAFVYGGLGFFAVLALLVMLYLPALVRERGPLVRAGVEQPAAPSPSGGAAPPAGAPAPVPQGALDAVLGELLASTDELNKINAGRWGGADWAEMRRLAEAGDAAYRVRDSRAALASYRAAATLARALLTRAPEVLESSLREGAAALAAGDQAGAISRFETAAAVSPGDARATRGLDRARKLDQVLALVSQASAAEAAGRRADALNLYRQAAALDPDWAAAGAGVARLQQAAARDAYETQMARGFAAQAGQDLAAAQAAFEAALKLRPGDAQARSALEQVGADRTLSRLAQLQAEAVSLERDERWADALQRHEAALAIDANLADARQGQERARSRLDLDQRLRRELGNADHFNDDAAYAKAKTLLETARGIAAPGPVLQRQVAELDGLLQLATQPIPVRLESDNLTQVTVFKVGRLGAFSNRTLELRPGAYVAVGSRPGYRDVRRPFRVAPGGEATPVVVRCEEPI
jgi:tetratricopeptide (TPR) repeat protein